MIRRIAQKAEYLARKKAIRPIGTLKDHHPEVNIEITKPDLIAHELQSDYRHYTAEVSKADMAISLELAAFMMSLCLKNNYTKLLDLGSGFSSFVFRKYALNNENVTVFSVDDDVQWLEKTRTFLQRCSLPTTNLQTLDKFIGSTEEQFDIVLLDLNFVEVRKNYIGLAVDRVKVGGLIVFDDVHKQDYLMDVLKQAAKLPLRLYDIRQLTVDEFDRHALVALKES